LYRQLTNRGKARYSEVDECDIIATGFGKRRHLVRQGKMIVKDEAKILSCWLHYGMDSDEDYYIAA